MPLGEVKVDPSSFEKLPRLVPRKKSAPPKNPIPAPETPQLLQPPNPSSLIFKQPTRRILSPRDHDAFRSSPTHSLILSFVFSLSESAADRKISSVSPTTSDPIIPKLLTILDEVEALILQNPPVDQGASRFGNPAFRAFIDAVSASSTSWHERTLGLASQASISEVSTYLYHSFGNRERIDYGSGHELDFITWLLCLNRLSLLPNPTFPALTLLVVPRYVKLLRKLQATYYLEPAGSHGVWGLDDYHFLPFLFGASQLLHHPYIRPLSIHNELVLEEEGDEYLYLDMVRFTMASKTVKGLKWTQPMLDDISGAKNWAKVEQGMRRMFVKEVLGKLPVMQHFLFGSLVPATEGMGRDEDAGGAFKGDKTGGNVVVENGGVKHVHDEDGWGDCCGIKIPSTVAASQAEKRRGDAEGFRRIPFD